MPGTLLAMRIRSSVRWRSAASAALTALGDDVGIALGVEVGVPLAVALGLAPSVGSAVCVGVGVSVGVGESVGVTGRVGLDDSSTVGEVVGAGLVGGVVHAESRASSATRTSERSRVTGSATVHRQA
jgi:hypothetical protein